MAELYPIWLFHFLGSVKLLGMSRKAQREREGRGYVDTAEQIPLRRENSRLGEFGHYFSCPRLLHCPFRFLLALMASTVNNFQVIFC